MLHNTGTGKENQELRGFQKIRTKGTSTHAIKHKRKKKSHFESNV